MKYPILLEALGEGACLLTSRVGGLSMAECWRSFPHWVTEETGAAEQSSSA